MSDARRLTAFAASVAILLTGVGAASTTAAPTVTSRSVSVSGWSPKELDGRGVAYAINERGWIVGEYRGRALVWQNGSAARSGTVRHTRCL